MYKVLKFGGSSIKTAKLIKNVTKIIKNEEKKYSIIVIVSAIGSITDKLNYLAKNINNPKLFINSFNKIKNFHQKIISNLGLVISENIKSIFNELENEMTENTDYNILQATDKITSYGERLSAHIIAEYLSSIGTKSKFFDSRKVILTDNNFGNALVDLKNSYEKIKNCFNGIDSTQIVTGFIGATKRGETTTIGRSGSDYTASIFAAALHAKEIQIWSDVDGILSANPKVIKNAKTIKNLSYREAMEMAHAGAKVIFPPTIIPALNHNIPISVKNTYNPKKPGSIITRNVDRRDGEVIGISSQSGMTLFRLQGPGMVGSYGIIGRIFTALAKEKINIVLVSQVFSEHSVCFVIQSDKISISRRLLKDEFEFELRNHIINRIVVEESVSLIALVGEGMRKKCGISGKLFKALGDKNINIIAIAQGSSETNISIVVDDEKGDEALKILHLEFFENIYKIPAIYLAGVGNVGKSLLKILNNNKLNNFNLNGIIRRKKMLLNQYGLDINSLENSFNSQSIKTDIKTIISQSKNNMNKIFIDCTDSKKVSENYLNLMSNGFSIVAANKKANTMNYNYFKKIDNFSRNSSVKYKYETNVGAGLPIISTIKSLISSGDKILKIEGVLSGTLSYLFNNYNGTISFSNLVKQAKRKGYTEPDPRNDLNGLDVARKLLIIARLIGLKIELSDIYVKNLLPDKSETLPSISEFLNFYEIKDKEFEALLENAKKQNKKLCYIGSINQKNIKVDLEMIDSNHDFYNISGSENIISIQTNRYFEKPIIIRGYGAGAEVTAAGIMADINSILEEI